MQEKADTIKLLHLKYLPKELEPGILYVSNEYKVAGHLCACGCGNKIITPLGPTEWTLTVNVGQPTLCPSIGNWQLPCRSHYWIADGAIKWSYQWTDKQIVAGYTAEDKSRKRFYNKLGRKRRKHFKISVFLSWLFRRIS